MQPSNEGSLLEIIDLAHALRQEQLFINNEQNTFMELNKTLTGNSENVSQLAWICSQQRQNLSNLIISKPDTGPSQCCRRANCLENAKFVSAYEAKGLKYQYVLAYTDLFNYLHRSPYLLGQCLQIGDRIYRSSPDRLSSIVETIISGLYDNVIHPKDVEMLLKLLQELIEIQIVDSDNPRRMFRTGSCAFSRLYHRLHESLFSAKLFLTASLFDPIMKVLIEDDIMLDIDPVKVAASITSKERLKKFGQIGTPEYDDKLIKYTEETIELLFNLANRFIKSLVLNWSLFPSTLRWLVQSMCHTLKRSQFSEKDINALLTEMIFTNFICPAVVSPDLYGIIDAPISENARFNLIQIGQILQMLALIKYEDVDPKMMELYKKFDRNLITNLLNQLQPNNEHGLSILAMSANPNSNNLGRRNVLITQTELNVFVEFLRNVLDNDGVTISGEDRRKLGDILERLPDKWENMLNEHQASNDNASIASTANIKNKTRDNLMSLQKKKTKILSKTISLNVPSLDSDTELPSSISLNGGTNHHSLNLSNLNGGNNHSMVNYNEYEQVLSIPISVSEVETKFQLLTEEQVLNMNNISNETVEPILTEKNVEELERQTEENEAIDGVVLRSAHTKHTRFSLSHDDASIGNTSDNLEAVSEAPSNHSVASSMELEENYQNDNLSDMVSANVSGRGTPNISGRDTPSSQVTEGENPRPPQIPTPQMAKILNKARSDIEDKFCKFEIKKLMEGDETISIISDTWSTDVLASDSETIEANDRDRNFSTPLIPSSVILPGDNNFNPLSGAGSQLRSQNLDVSETHSESAWSTDVLASDSEKMTEIDTDDNQSIAAKSDITDQNHNRRNHRMNQAPDSPMFFTQRLSNLHFRTPESPMYQGRNSSSDVSAINGDSGIGGVSESIGEVGGPGGSANNDLSFFAPNQNYADDNYPRYAGSSISLLRHSRDLNNAHDLASISGSGGSGGAIGGVDHHSGVHHRNHHHHHRRSHHHRSQANNNDSSTTFLDCFDDSSYLTPPRHGLHSTAAIGIVSKRQNSIESNNSEISSNFDSRDENKKLFDYRKQTKDYVENTPVVHEYKPYDIETINNNSDSNVNNNNNNNKNNNVNNSDSNSDKNSNNQKKYSNYDHQGYRRLENNNTVDDDFEDALANANDEDVIKTSTNLINPFDDGTPEIIPCLSEHDLSDDLVEHRRMSSEQRNASFDGRRNGMIDYTNSKASSSPLNTENNNTNNTETNVQVITNDGGTIITTTINTCISRAVANSYENHEIITKKQNQADDELILVKKTSSLNLNNNNNNSAINNNNITNNSVNNNNHSHSNHSIKHTGAIPKSISFDSSADKINGHHRNNNNNNSSNNNTNINSNIINKNNNSNNNNTNNSNNNLHLNTHHNPKRADTVRVQSSGFFNKIKQGFKNRRGHKFRSLHDIDLTAREFSLLTSNPNNTSSSGSTSGHLCNGSNAIHPDLLNLDSNYSETTEDILAKYRRKASSSSDAAASDSTGSNVSSSKSNKSNSDTEQHNNNLLTNDDTLFLFNNAKRKLRIVLSSIDLQTSDFYHSCYSIASPLIIYLQIQLAQALNINDLKQISYVSEIIRCMNLMTFHDHQKLLDEMHQDIFKRQTYIQYLIRYRQNLLTSIENLKRFEFRLQNDREFLNRHLIMVCVRMFLEKRDTHIQKFNEKFQTLTIVDDKIDYLDECMIQLMDELRSDGILQGMADWQLQEARTCIERILLQRVYRQVMFPNDDGDIARDQVLREHIRKLSRRISPAHPNLRIPQEFLFEAPWPFAQQQMSYISAYKTPKGKVECVVRCVQSIMNLLSMASHRVPSADDLTPVLIYVIIKANPPHLLSTIDYVNSFIGEKLEGETQYWWTQFCSAVTFIKTMDYGE